MPILEIGQDYVVYQDVEKGSSPKLFVCQPRDDGSFLDTIYEYLGDIPSSTQQKPFNQYITTCSLDTYITMLYGLDVKPSELQVYISEFDGSITQYPQSVKTFPVEIPSDYQLTNGCLRFNSQEGLTFLIWSVYDAYRRSDRCVHLWKSNVAEECPSQEIADNAEIIDQYSNQLYLFVSLCVTLDRALSDIGSLDFAESKMYSGFVLNPRILMNYFYTLIPFIIHDVD